MEKFFSEDRVDQWCSENLTIPKIGLAIDVGAAHPDRYSNTAWLRNRGWDLLAIDGDPAYAPEWDGIQGQVGFRNAVISDNVEASFLAEPTNALVSRIHPEGQKVRSVNLAQFLKREIQIPDRIEWRTIDFMSIDIENSEPIAMRQMFEVMWYPDILVVEYNSLHAGINVRTLEMPLMTGRYRLRYMTNSNAVFSK